MPLATVIRRIYKRYGLELNFSDINIFTGTGSQKIGSERDKGRKVKVSVSRSIDAETKNAPYLPMGRSSNFNLGTGMRYI